MTIKSKGSWERYRALAVGSVKADNTLHCGMKGVP